MFESHYIRVFHPDLEYSIDWICTSRLEIYKLSYFSSLIHIFVYKLYTPNHCTQNVLFIIELTQKKSKSVKKQGVQDQHK